MGFQSILTNGARAALLATLALGGASVMSGQFGAPQALAGNYEPDDLWKDLSNDIFKGRAIEDGKSVLTLETPVRAEDAAIVPMTMSFTLPAQDTRRVVKVTLVVDQNPAPVVAAFTVGETASPRACASMIIPWCMRWLS